LKANHNTKEKQTKNNGIVANHYCSKCFLILYEKYQ